MTNHLGFFGRLALQRIVLPLIVLVLTFGNARAQDVGAPTIKLMHTPIAPDALPPLGSFVRIGLVLLNTTDVTTQVRLVGSKDGRYIDISFPKGALNRQDRPEYSIDIPAPVAGMTYQFVVHQPNGSLSTSERYAMKRPCVQNFTVEVPSDSPSAPYQREVATLETKASRLKQDADSLDASLKLLEDIRTSINQTPEQHEQL